MENINIEQNEVVIDRNQISGIVSDDQILGYKAKYGEVHEVIVEDKACYLKRPDRKVISMATTIGKSDPVKFSEIMLANCWISGDEEIKTNDTYFFGVAGTLGDLFKSKVASIKKL